MEFKNQQCDDTLHKNKLPTTTSTYGVDKDNKLHPTIVEPSKQQRKATFTSEEKIQTLLIVQLKLKFLNTEMHTKLHIKTLTNERL